MTTARCETQYGNPLTQDGLHMGPLMNQAGLDKVATLVESAKAQGAQVRTGGRVADRPGFHDEPTVLVGCTDEMDVMTKEIFDPVLPAAWIDRLAEFFTDLQVEVLPEAGHFVHLEYPDRAAEDMAAFFDQPAARERHADAMNPQG